MNCIRGLWQLCMSALLLGRTLALDDDYAVSFFAENSKKVCLGKSVELRGPAYHYDLFFKPNTPGSSELQVTNMTHVFLPDYIVKDTAILITEVKTHHLGEYSWASYGSESFLRRLKKTELILDDCSVHKELHYGLDFSLEIPKKASMLEFTPSGSQDGIVRWSRSNTDNQRGARGTVTDNVWLIWKVRYEDAGRYAFLNSNGAEISSTTLVVTVFEKQFDLSDSTISNFWENHVTVPASELVLTFTDSSARTHVLFQNGMATEEAFQLFHNRIEFKEVNGYLAFCIKSVSACDEGLYEARDRNNLLAVEIFLISNYALPPQAMSSDASDYAIPVGICVVIAMLVFCCCCLKGCIKKGATPSVASPPPDQPVHIHEYTVIGQRPPPQLQVSEFTVIGRRPSPRSQPQAGMEDGLAPDLSLEPEPASATSNCESPPSYDELMRDAPQPYYSNRVATPTKTNTGQREAANLYGERGEVQAIPSAPPDPGYQYQPRDWPGAVGDFLSSAPLGPDTNGSSAVYNSDKMNF